MPEVGAKVVKKAVLFDLYGTLIDIRTDEYDIWVYNTLSRYLSYHGVDVAPEKLKEAYFTEIQQILRVSTQQYPEVDVFSVFFTIMHRYGTKKYSRTIIIDTAKLFRALTRRSFSLFPNVREVLASLSQEYKTALISDAQWTFTFSEMAQLDIVKFFGIKVLSSIYGFKKPDTRLFQLAADKLKVDPADCIYVGDNPRKDLVGAKMAGMGCFLFRSGCQSYDGFQPDGCFNDYSRFPVLLKEVELSS